ncbi:hypothetical protein JW890_02450, partial [candidate division WOR-3 bacterium]|nr:hypothetical protein [candidate division WOR-3 bacterium]
KKPSNTFLKFLNENEVHLQKFGADKKAFDFPLAVEVFAAKSAEEIFSGKFDLLVWLGSNTLFFDEPGHLLIPQDKTVGLRPVHHMNIGSLSEKPMDAFWTMIYNVCSVSEDKIFPMKTHIDEKTIRPYFNATFLVERPESGILSKWRVIFDKHYLSPEFLEFFERDNRFAVFMHQAILTGVILSETASEDLLILPGSYNYPLHLWEEDITEDRPRSLKDITAARHEGFYLDKAWKNKMPEGDKIKNWLKEQLSVFLNN